MAEVLQEEKANPYLEYVCITVILTARRSNQSILKEINSEYSLEGLRLELKLQCLELELKLQFLAT